MEIREEVEHDIWWQLKSRTTSFWFDNWSKIGALYFLEDQPNEFEMEVKEFITDWEWDRERLLQIIIKGNSD